MRIPTQRRQLLAGICAAALAVAAVVALAVQHEHKPSTGGSSSQAVTIAASGGARLAARVYSPSGSGRFPLVVMPASWGSGATEYAAVATGFAVLGYEVVAYAQRGFGGSTGAVDFAGPATRDDVSTVIDWARAQTSANPGAVAVVGASYGAGVGLLAAEHDPRIKAVAAISGWADFSQTLAPGNTLSETDYQALFTGQLRDRQLSSQLRTLVIQLATKQSAAALATVRAMSPVRSPSTGVAALNKNKTAVFLASTYQDSIASPGNLISFYDKLTGPKQLQLAPGDHGASAILGLYGQRTPLWTSVAKWVARYINNGPGLNGRPVQLTDARTGATHGYGSFPSGQPGDSVRLGAAGGQPSTGTLDASADPAWTQSITAGVPTSADAGPSQVLTGRAYQPPTTSIANVSRSAAVVWTGAALTSDEVIAGQPRVHVTVSSTAPSASLFAYLYDVDAAGTGTLLSFGVTTLTGTAGAAQAANIELGPIAWTVAAGHQLSLVIDSTDARYLGRSVPGSTITLSSSASDPATLSLPVG
jgi:putative CocE/NonD family hydrolase